MSEKRKEIRSGIKTHIFLTEAERLSGVVSITALEKKIKLKGWILTEDIESITDHNGRAYIDVVSRFEKTPAGFTHIMFPKVKPPDADKNK